METVAQSRFFTDESSPFFRKNDYSEYTSNTFKESNYFIFNKSESFFRIRTKIREGAVNKSRTLPDFFISRSTENPISAPPWVRVRAGRTGAD